MTTEETSAHAPVPGDPDYPPHSEKTIGRYFRDQVAIDPDHEFVVYPDRMLRWTYKDFDERTDNLARGLLAIGLRPGDHLGVWARNIPDWLTFMYATAKIGVVMVTVNPIYKSHELDYVLKQSDMKALCVIDAYRDVDYLQIIRELVPETLTQQRGYLESEAYPCLKHIIYMGPEKHRGCYSVPELILLGQHVPADALEEAETHFDNNSVVMMQYTSGTTGFPKGVMLTHRNILNNGFYIGEGQKLTADDRVTLPVPFFHCFGCVLGVMAIPHAPLHHDHRGGFRRRARAAGHPQGARHGRLRRAHHVHRRAQPPRLRHVRPVQPAHGHHGRQPLPAGNDARGHGQDVHEGDHHLLRPHRDEPRVHADERQRRHRAQVRDGGPGAPAGGRARHRPGRRPYLRAGRAGRALLQGLQRHEGLLQDARGHGRGHRRRRLPALRRPGHRATRMATTA